MSEHVGRIAEDWGLEEAWSVKARVAALLARREKARAAGHVVGGGDPRLAQDRRDTELRLAQGIGSLRHGETFRQRLPEGSIDVTRVGTRGHRTEYHVAGGGQAVDADLRRGPRALLGRGNVEREVLERQRSAHAAEEDHTATHAAAVHALATGGSHHLQALGGEMSAISKTPDGKFRVDHGIEGAPHTTHETATQAVEHAKKVLRDHKQARFLETGEHSDPLSTVSADQILKNSVLIGAHKDAPQFSERTDRLNPVGAIGDVAPEMASSVLARTMAPGLGGERLGATSDLPQHLPHLGHAAAAVLSHPATHHVITHVHQVHHLLAGIEQFEGELQDALDVGDEAAAAEAQRAGARAREKLAEELERVRVQGHGGAA